MSASAVIVLIFGLACASVQATSSNGSCTVNHSLHPHESDCSKFYKCDNFKLVMMECPAGLHWHQARQVCNWPDPAGCESSEVPVNPPSPGTCSPDSPKPVCPPHVAHQHAVHLPHEYDCNKFYQCNWGERFLMNCPQGLEFHPYLQVCDFPYRTPCACKNP